MRCKHKSKGLDVPLKGLKLGIWMEIVTEASSMLGLLCTDEILNLEPIPKAKSRSSKKARVALTSMEYFHVKGRDLKVNIEDVSKCERNRKPRKYQCIVCCLSYMIYDCSKLFCVSKRWWGKRPLDSDGKYDLLTNHWGYNFKRLHEEVKIEINTFKMDENHLLILHHHHLYRHGHTIFPCFGFENMNFIKDRIKGIAITNTEKIESNMKEVIAAKRESLDSEKRITADNSVQLSYV